MVLRRKNGMLLKWVTQAPMERLKEMLVSGRNVVQGAQRFSEVEGRGFHSGLSQGRSQKENQTLVAKRIL